MGVESGLRMARLCVAAGLGDLDALGAELAKGVDPNGVDARGRLPLGQAAAGGSLDAVKALLKAGALPEARDGDGKNALHHAAESRAGGCLGFLLSLKRIPIDARCSIGRSTALHLAARLGDDEAAAKRMGELLEAGADSAAADSAGRTALAIACSRGHVLGCEELFDFGADPNLANASNGETPLMIAAKHGWEDCVGELLKEGALVLALDRDGFSALRHAASAGSARACEFLMGAGAKHGEKCVQGKTPVDAAREAGHSDLADWLASAKFAVDERVEIHAASGRSDASDPSPEPARPRSKSRL